MACAQFISDSLTQSKIFIRNTELNNADGTAGNSRIIYVSKKE